MNLHRIAATLSLALLTAGAGFAWLAQMEDEPQSAVTGLGSPSIPAAIDAVSAPAEPPESGASVEPVADLAVVRDWTQARHEAADHFVLARDLVEAALNGDARAAYVLGEVLMRCEVYERVLSAYEGGTVAERVESHLAGSNLPQAGLDAFRQGALRCQTLFSADPFEGYEVPDGANDFRYWSDRAVESRDPVAVMNRRFRSAVGRQATDDPEEEQAFRAALLSDVHLAVVSRDPAALFMVGGMFSDRGLVADPDSGYAWLVAACESGYDCSYANPDVGSGCVNAGTCVPGFTLLDTMQRDLGATQYAAIYAEAQDIQYRIGVDDWDGLQQYLQLK
jgi:hypothetical protein